MAKLSDPRPVFDPRMISKFDLVWSKNDPLVVVWACTAEQGAPLKCTKHATDAWCQDLQAVLSQNIDAEQLWADGPVQDILVPIMPTEGIFEAVKLIEVEDGDGMCEVSWSGNDTWSEAKTFLGYLSPGQGRIMLRELIINQLEVELAEIGKCSSPTHGVAAEREWRDNNLSVKKGFVNRYFVMKYGKCPYCFRAIKSLGSNDLIPGTEESNGPKFWSDAQRAAISRATAADAKARDRAARSRAPGAPYSTPVKDPKDFTPVFSPVTRDDKTGEMF